MSVELATEIFEKGIEEGLSRDLIIVDMVKGGLSLNAAQNAYKELATEAGLTTARVGHKAEALELLAEEAPIVSDADVRLATRVLLQEKFGVAASTANDYIKAYAEIAGIEMPRSNFGSSPEDQEKIFNFIVANPNCEKADFTIFMKEEMGRSSGSIDETYRGIVLARKLADIGVEFE